MNHNEILGEPKGTSGSKVFLIHKANNGWILEIPPKSMGTVSAKDYMKDAKGLMSQLGFGALDPKLAEIKAQSEESIEIESGLFLFKTYKELSAFIEYHFVDVEEGKEEKKKD